jgi:hypothetical protein
MNMEIFRQTLRRARKMEVFGFLLILLGIVWCVSVVALAIPGVVTGISLSIAGLVVMLMG